MNNEELKTCPFCGGEAEIVISGGDRRVDCKKCGARSDWYDTEAEAIAAWNRREASCTEKQNSSKLTYADVEKMVNPLEWGYRRCEDKGDCEYAYINPTTSFEAVGSLGDCRFIFWDELGYVVDTFAIVEDGEKSLDAQKQNARKFLVDLVADALGVKRSGE